MYPLLVYVGNFDENVNEIQEKIAPERQIRYDIFLPHPTIVILLLYVHAVLIRNHIVAAN